MIKLNKNNKGAALTEYAILAGLIGVVAIAVVLQFGATVTQTFDSVSDELRTASLTPSAIEAVAEPTLIDIGPQNGTFDFVTISPTDNEIIDGFDEPIDNGDGTYSGVDIISQTVTGATANNVSVSDNAGSAMLTFPNGKTLTILGISPIAANSPDYLNAIGLPF